ALLADGGVIGVLQVGAGRGVEVGQGGDAVLGSGPDEVEARRADEARHDGAQVVGGGVVAEGHLGAVVLHDELDGRVLGDGIAGHGRDVVEDGGGTGRFGTGGGEPACVDVAGSDAG